MDASKEPQCRYALISEGDYESTGSRQGPAMPETSLTFCKIDCVRVQFFLAALLFQAEL